MKRSVAPKTEAQVARGPSLIDLLDVVRNESNRIQDSSGAMQQNRTGTLDQPASTDALLLMPLENSNSTKPRLNHSEMNTLHE